MVFACLKLRAENPPVTHVYGRIADAEWFLTAA